MTEPTRDEVNRVLAEKLNLKCIPGHEQYAADRSGGIWNLENKWQPVGPRKLKQSIDLYGYPTVRIWINGKHSFRKVHALVCMAFHGPRPIKHETRHLNGIRDDNRPENLAWGTTKENYEDRRKHGNDRMRRGIVNKLKTHCKFGHPFIEENIYRDKNDRRVCKPCRRIRGQAHYRAAIAKEGSK